MENNKTSIKDIVLKVLFILVIVAVIILLAFAVIRFIPLVFSGFVSAGKLVTSPFSNNSLEVSVNDSQLSSGDQFQVSWKHTPKTEGFYDVRYACSESLSLYILDNNQRKTLLCNTPYTLDSDTKSVTFEVDLDKDNVLVDLPIEISFVDNITRKIEKTEQVIISVSNESSDRGAGNLTANTTIVSEPVSTTQNKSVTVSNPIPTITGPADLSISNLIAIGDEAVRFDVANIGGRSTGVWIFNYDVPGEGTEISPLQISLNPGDVIRYTLTFDGSDEGNFEVELDPFDLVSEASESNNRSSVRINGGDGNGNGNVNYNSNDDADLEISDLEVGRMSGSSFREDDEIDEGDDAAIRFTVANIGGESTGSWRFEVDDIPYDGNNDYRSNRQDSLRPGESVEIIVEFENADEGNYDIDVNVDSDDDVDEEDERNNDADERLRVRD